MAEGPQVVDGTTFDGTVIDGAQYAGVEGDRIGHHAATLEPDAVLLHRRRRYGVEHDVAAEAELTEAVKRRTVGLGGAYAAVILQRADDSLHKGEEGVLPAKPPVFLHYVVGRIVREGGLEATLYFCETPQVAANVFADFKELFAPRAAGGNDDIGMPHVPFGAKEFTAGKLLAHTTLVRDTVVEGSLDADDCGGPEFYFYCSHFS